MPAILLLILSILLAIDVVTWSFIIIVEHRDLNKTAAWIVITVILPVIGCIGYFVIGQRIWLYGSYKGRKVSGGRLTESEMPDGLSFLEGLEGADLTFGNRTEFLSDGKEMFDRLMDDIRNANRSIHLEYYIMMDDELGKNVFETLASKAKEGLDVKVIGDGFGCRKLSDDTKGMLKESGVELILFQEVGASCFDPKKNNRDHRKNVIIDGRICYCGGFNICMDYIGMGHLGHWRDSAVRVEGDIAGIMEKRFLKTCGYCGSDSSDATTTEPMKAGGDAMVSVYGGPDMRPNPILELHLGLIREAKKEILLQTPYFTNKEMIRAVKEASERGVKVKLILPGRPDHWFTFWNNYSCARVLKGTSVDMMLYQKGFIHSKAMIVDERICVIGSSNFDDRTAYYNFETSLAIMSDRCIASMREAFDEDMKNSKHLVFSEFSGFVPFVKRMICGIVRCLG